MAVVSLKIPDETYEEYAKHAPDDPRRGMEAQLERFKGLPPGERILFFDPASQKELERLFQRPIEEPSKLVEWVKKLQELQIGGVDVSLTEGQVKRLSNNARFFNTTPEEYLKKQLLLAVRDVLGV